MSDDSMLRVRVTSATLAALRAFIRDRQPDLGCRPAARLTDAGFEADVYLSQSALDAAANARSTTDVQLTVVENATEVGVARRKEVGQGDRFASRGAVPRGVGRKQ